VSDAGQGLDWAYPVHEVFYGQMTLAQRRPWCRDRLRFVRRDAHAI